MARTEDSYLAKANEQAQLQAPAGQVDPVDTAIPEPLVAVPVRDESPAQGNAGVVVLSANNPVLPVLAQDPRRRRAILLAVDSDVYLSQTRDLAATSAGTNTGTQAGYLPAGIAVPIDSKNAWYVAATTLAASSRVTVLVFKDDE